jgi:hypothetical protein
MSRKFKKLTLQYSFLKLEKEEVEEICHKQEKELHDYMLKNHPEYYEKKQDSKSTKNKETENVTEPLNNHEKEDTNYEDCKTELSDEIDVNKDIVKNKDLKKLYRKIAAKTHPDKIGNDKHAGIFSAAARAYENNNLAILLDIASGLNIEISELSPESIKLLENNIVYLSGEINKMKSSTGWAWHKANTKEEKQKIINIILKQRGVI